MEKPLDKILEIKDLKVELMSPDGLVTAVRGANLTVNKGEIHGIVGESGCGKSVMMKSVMRLHDEKKTAYEGSINFDNTEILSMKPKELQRLRGKDIAMIFQNPMTSLSPIMKVGEQITEAVLAKQKISREEAKSRAYEILELVGITPAADRYNMYPFELSGGLLQRVMIAMAMVNNPTILIADEPTTALDVTIQKQVLILLNKLKKTMNTGVLFITHDLGVVAEIADRVIVLYSGTKVEEGSAKQIFENNMHPYTQGLLAAVPNVDKDDFEIKAIPGTFPAITEKIEGCRFHPRCPYATDRCRSEVPQAKEYEKGHFVACHKVEEEHKC